MLRGTHLKDRVQLFRELATMVDSGMSLGMACSALSDRPGSPEQQLAIRDAARRVSTGKRFSEVMRDHPRVFSELNVALVAAGEQGGHLDTMLNACADYLEQDLEFQQTVSRETLYPKILAAAIVLIPLGMRVIIAAVLQGATAAFLVALNGLALITIIVCVPALVLYLIYRKYVTTKQGRLAIAKLKLRVPLIGPIVQRLAWARMSRALAALYGAGVSIDKAVELAGKTAGNLAIAEMMRRAVPTLTKGGKLSDALLKTGQVPSLALSMLRTGEATGNIDGTMLKVGDYFEAEATSSLKKLATSIVPIAVLIAGVVVGVMAVQFYTHYFGQLLKQ